jgi:hypothetical protein
MRCSTPDGRRMTAHVIRERDATSAIDNEVRVKGR